MIFPWRTWLNEYWIWCRYFGNVYLWSSFYLPIHPLLPLLQHYSYQIQSPHFRRAARFLRGTEVAFRAKKEVKNFDIRWLDVSVRFAFIFISLRTSHSPRTLISGNLRERQTQSLPAALSRQFFQIWLICKTEECFFHVSVIILIDIDTYTHTWMGITSLEKKIKEGRNYTYVRICECVLIYTHI